MSFLTVLYLFPVEHWALKVIAVRTSYQSSLDTYWILLVPESMEYSNAFVVMAEKPQESVEFWFG